jgi:hypothetical protein
MAVNVPGPLVVSSANPRYFAVAGGGPVVYLTGAHFNSNLQDGLGPGRDCPEEPEAFDYPAYLAALADRGHNFVRLWRWEQFMGYLPGADVHFCMTPQPWPRAGAGTALDGQPCFDLTQFDPAYFTRLRERVVAAGAAGMYVSVMFFEGFSLHLTETPTNITGHPFHGPNNVNGVDIASIRDYQELPLDPAIESLQVAYIRHVVDAVHDLPNVLYEVANESSGVSADVTTMPDGTTIDTPSADSSAWQYWVIDVVKRHERDADRTPHPIGMTFQFPVADQSAANDPLWRSPADWISPGFDEADAPSDSRWRHDPPANDGAKVIISDTDHYSPMEADAVWAWKAFLRGHNPILYDLGLFGGFDPLDPALEPARWALGDTARLAAQLDLARTEPHGELAASGFALCRPGHDYAALRPADADGAFWVEVPPGTYDVRWFDVDDRRQLPLERLVVDEPGRHVLTGAPPADHAAVVRLTVVG